MPASSVQTLGFTQKSLAATIVDLMDDYRREAGKRLMRLREARRLSQEDLAHLAKLSVKTISRFENGRHDGRRSTVERLATALNVTADELMGMPPVPLALGDEETQLDRIEAKLDKILDRLAGEPALASQAATHVRQHLEGLADEPVAKPQAPAGNGGQSGSKRASAPARSRGKRRSG